jgi:hypothetical protein
MRAEEHFRPRTLNLRSRLERGYVLYARALDDTGHRQVALGVKRRRARSA